MHLFHEVNVMLSVQRCSVSCSNKQVTFHDHVPLCW